MSENSRIMSQCRFNYCIYLLLVWLAVPVFSESSRKQVVLTLEKAVKRGMRYNAQRLIDQKEKTIQQNREHKRQVKWLPELSLQVSPDVSAAFISEENTTDVSVDDVESTDYWTNHEVTPGLDMGLVLTEKMPSGTSLNIKASLGWLKLPTEDATVDDSLSISLRQPLTDFFSGFPEMTKDRAEYLRARNDIVKRKRRRKNLIYDIHHAYFSLYKAREVLTLARKQYAVSQKFYQRSLNQLEMGTISEIKAMKIKLNTLEKNNEVTGLKKNEEQRTAALRRMLGYDDQEVRFQLRFSLPELSISLPAVGAFQQRHKEFDDYQLAQNDYRIAKQQWRLNGQTLPFALTAEVTYTLSRSYMCHTAVAEDDIPLDDAAAASLSFRMPLWDWGKKEKDDDSQRKTYEQETIRFKESVASLKDRYRDSLFQLKQLTKEKEINRVRLKIAKKTYEIDVDRFNLSIIDTQTFINSQTSYSSAKLNDLTARIDYYLAVLKFEHRFFALRKEKNS